MGSIELRNSHAKDMRILTREWPANILANKRIPKLTALETYDTNSISIMKGAIAVGVPVGYSIEKYLTLWIEKPISINATMVDILNKNVNEASDVVVSTPGTIPKILALNIDACTPEVVISFSSHSLSPASSSSKIAVPLVARATVAQSAIPSSSPNPVKSTKSSKYHMLGKRSNRALSSRPTKLSSSPNWSNGENK